MLSLKKVFLFSFIAIFPFLHGACQKKEEKAPVKVEIPEEVIPDLTQDRLDLWFDLAVDLGRYVRKFSLDDESVEDKRELMMIVHNSSRAQIAYESIFKEKAMSMKEFWSVLNEMKKAEKYIELKKNEIDINSRIDVMVAAGREEVKRLGKILETASGEEKKKLEKIISDMEVKITEFELMRSSVTPESVFLSQELLALWKKNKDRFTKAMTSMWKVAENPHTHR